jgi:hypothetical protein
MPGDPNRLVWRRIHWPARVETPLALGLMRRLAADQPRTPVVFEARSREGRVSYLVGTAAHQIEALTRLFTISVPEVTVEDSAPDNPDAGTSFRVRVAPRAVPLGVRPPAESARSLLGALTAAVRTEETATVRVVLGRGRPPSLLSPIAPDPTQSWFDVLLRGSRAASADMGRRMRDRASEPGFSASVRISASAASEGRRLTILRGLAAALRTHQAPGVRIEMLADRRDGLPKRLPLPLSVPETLAFLAWPIDASDLPGLPPAHPVLLRAAELPRKADRIFARTSAPGATVPVGISGPDSLFHTLFLGPTGSGKSTAMLNLICADIDAGNSVVVIDPKSDLVRDVLARVPASREADVVVLDPTSRRAVGLNPLVSPGTPPELVADGLVSVFRDLFPTGLGPNVSDALHAPLLTLASAPGSTLTDLPLLFADRNFRANVLADAGSQPELQGWWARYEAMSPGQQAQLTGPVLTRLRQFLLRPALRRILDQAEPAFQLADVMRRPRILLVPLNAGILGGESARLLGSLLVTQLWQLTLARAGTEPDGRRRVSVFVDEVQEYLRLGGGDLADALARSRSLGVAWHLAHQYRDQLDPATRRAVDANVRNIVTFSLSHADAREMSQTAPGLTAEDFESLPQFAVYARVLASGRPTGWFSANTAPARTPSADPAAIRAASEHRWGSPASETPPESPRDNQQAIVKKETPAFPIGRRKRSEP